MPRFIDVHHKVDGLTPEMIAAAHARDLEVQDKHGVKFLTYWYDEATGKVFCLSEGPNLEAANAVHAEAHGALADEVYEVKEGQ
jgi:hypothetical protein